jgi:prolipoprotein diacylglyceryltransferase
METQTPEMVTSGMGILGCVFFAVFAVFMLAALAFTIWMLIDAIKRVPSEENKKLIWILVIIFTGVIGAAIYFFVQRPKNPPQT